MMRLAEVMGWISFAAMILPVGIGWFRWRVLTTAQRKLTILVGLLLVNMVLSVAVGYIWGLNNLVFNHVYVGIEGLFLLYLLRSLTRDIIRPFLHAAILCVFIAVWLGNLLAGESHLTFANYTRTLESWLVLILTFVYWINLPVGTRKTVWRQPAWWMTLGWSIYFAGNLLLFAYSNYVEQQATDHAYGLIWTVHGILNLWLYAAYARAVSCPYEAQHGNAVSV